ncbi:MAG: M48 family metallopeptidase [Anaerolineales bacterium]
MTQIDELNLDPEKQESAKRYARIRRRMYVLDIALGGLYLLWWLVSGTSILLEGSISELNVGWAAELILVAFLIFLPWTILFLPLDFYSGYILPHRFGLSTQDIRGWLTDLLKSFGVSILLGVPLLVGLYALIRVFPETWWLWAVIGYTLIGTVLTILAPVLLLPLFYKLEPLGEAYQELVERLLMLADRAKATAQGVYTIDMSRRTRAANAALVGMGKTRRILLGDTLIESFTTDEIESVLAHELGHHVHRDIPLSILIQSGLNLIVFFVGAKMLEWIASSLGIPYVYNPALLPALVLVFSIVGFLTMPIGNAFSRWRETMADDFALNMTQNPSAFVNAMTRLANQNLAEASPERWVVFLLHSHPPLEDRIARAKRFTVQST